MQGPQALAVRANAFAFANAFALDLGPCKGPWGLMQGATANLFAVTLAPMQGALAPC